MKSLDAGESIELVEETDDWFKVIYKHDDKLMVGYMHRVTIDFGEQN